MHDLYAFVRGPLAWAAFALFFGGCLYRLIQLLVLVHRKERFIYSYMSWKYSLRSILHWMTPFATVNMRQNRVLTVVTFAFHLGLIVTPVLLLSHVGAAIRTPEEQPPVNVAGAGAGWPNRGQEKAETMKPVGAWDGEEKA